MRLPAAVILLVCLSAATPGHPATGTSDVDTVAIRQAGAASRMLERTSIPDLVKLAEDGDTRAQYHLGIELLKGERVARDLVQGYAWLETAADCGVVCSSAEASAAAQDARLKLHRMLSGPQLLEAGRISQAFLSPRLATHREAVTRIEQALLGRVSRPGTLHTGCASSPTLPGCEALPKPVSRSHCSGAVEKPDRTPSDRGPLARLRPPRYPADAIEQLVEGRVVIAAHVDYTGYVCEAGLVRSSGNPRIDGAALDSLLRWRFEPAVLGGEPVDALFSMTIDFSLAADGAP